MLYTLAFVKASTYRSRIMLSLAESTKTPKQLSQELDVHQNNVSATLRELKEKGLVEIVNPEAKKWRYYRLTDVVKEIVDKLE